MNGLTSNLKKYISLVVINIFNLLPIKKNKIFLFSYYGSQYGCSPKYISEYIVENYPKEKFDVVWAFNDVLSKRNIKGVRKVKTMSLKYFYELCTAKVVITNFRTTDIFIKRKNQYYIQTWHSSLRLKQIERDAEKSLPINYVKMAKRDSLKCNLLLSGCKYSTEIFKRAFWYDGEIFEHGTPRNDIFFRDNLLEQDKIKSKFNIPNDYKVILYAPTFRKGNELEVYNLDYSRISSKLENKFGRRWVFLVKLHPHLISKASELVYDNNVIDVTTYDDIQELLSISDILITDYSSLMFDFALTNRPCFLYVPDIEEYTNNDRKLYFNIKQLPFLCAANNNDLLDKIENFNYIEYKHELINFSKQIGTFEEGKACEELVNHINKVCFN
jgi:CDP-glycerol glycerophosphotransferase